MQAAFMLYSPLNEHPWRHKDFLLKRKDGWSEHFWDEEQTKYIMTSKPRTKLSFVPILPLPKSITLDQVANVKLC